MKEWKKNWNKILSIRSYCYEKALVRFLMLFYASTYVADSLTRKWNKIHVQHIFCSVSPSVTDGNSKTSSILVSYAQWLSVLHVTYTKKLK